jgi:predicted MPP superfamily phosphohydrolase
MRRVIGSAVAVSALGLGWGWFEAGWVRFRRLDLPVAGLAEDVRLVHLSDFHLGVPSRGSHAVARAVEWAADRNPDLVCITGDLVSHPRGEPVLRDLLAKLPCCFAVLGNHDVEHSRDPFSRSAGLTDLAPARLLVDEAETVDVRGMRVQVVGVDPRRYRQRGTQYEELADREADLRILLCHFPQVFDRLTSESFDLVLAGHMHDGQISVPLPRDKLRLAHLNARFTTGLYERDGMRMHVSPGLGTTFVPFRFYARPEATELVLQRAAK